MNKREVKNMKRLSILFILGIIILLSSCSNLLVKQQCSPIYALNTVIDVTFYNVDNYEEHYNEIKKIYNDVHRVANDFEPNYDHTSVFDLNINRTIEGSDLLIDIINCAVEMQEETDGYFNPFIGRISRLWKNAIATGVKPTGQVLELEVEMAHKTNVIIEGNTITLDGYGSLDLGGIAKGYATQLVHEYLKKNNITSYLINAGNSNVICGNKNGKSFNLGLVNPLTNSYFGYVKGVDLMLSTSSHQHQGIMINNKFYHHIINPFIGFPENYYDSVNVVCDNSMYADAYSTALFSMDIETAKEFVARKNLKALFLKDNEIIFETIGDELHA